MFRVVEIRDGAITRTLVPSFQEKAKAFSTAVLILQTHPDRYVSADVQLGVHDLDANVVETIVCVYTQDPQIVH